MEKIALLGDIHFNRTAENPIVKKHIKEGQIKFFDGLPDILKQNNIKTVICTGDLHHTRISINVESLVTTKRILKEKLKDFDIHIILGNHDIYYENSYDVGALELFEDIPNVTVYRNGVVKQNFLGKEWYIFPWIILEKQERVIKFLEKMSRKSKNVRDNTILLGHFTMIGIDMEGGNISNIGLDPNLFLNAARMIISGHYHGRSVTSKSGSDLLYVGSPYPMTFANAGLKHGFWILDEDLNYEFIENKTSPNFVDVWDTELSKFENTDFSNSFIRFYLNGDRSREDIFNICLQVENKNPLLIKKIPYSGEKTEEEKAEVQRETNKISAMDTIELSEVFIDQNFDMLPELKLFKDPKDAILKKVKSYKEQLNLN